MIMKRTAHINTTPTPYKLCRFHRVTWITITIAIITLALRLRSLSQLIEGLATITLNNANNGENKIIENKHSRKDDSMPLTCQNETGIRDGYLREYCCATWEVPGDDW